MRCCLNNLGLMFGNFAKIGRAFRASHVAIWQNFQTSRLPIIISADSIREPRVEIIQARPLTK